jgi:hypothetical protein
MANGPCKEFDVFRASAEELTPPQLRELVGFVRDRFPDTGAEICRLGRESIEDETVVALLHALIRMSRDGFARFDAEEFSDTHPAPSDKDVMRLLSKTWSESDRSALDLMIYRFCAISDSDLRHGTLARLLDQWSRILGKDAPKELRIDSSMIRQAVVDAGCRYPWLLIEGPDEVLRALDNHPHPYEYPEIIAGPADEDWPQPAMSVGIRSPSLRTVIIDEMTESVSAEAIRAMHRLLAEESFRQQTIIARHSRWDDARDLRFFRRSIQALYHGFKSIGPPVTSGYIDFTGITTVLPQDPAAAFRRLYSVFYRTELEVPPLWEVSRMLGGDPVKAALLWVAVTAPSSISELAPRRVEVLMNNLQLMNNLRLIFVSGDTGHGIAEQDDAMVRDLIAGLARAAYLTDNRILVHRAIGLARGWEGVTHRSGDPQQPIDNPLTAAEEAAFLIKKVQVDEIRLSGGGDDAMAACRGLLSEIGISPACLEKISDAATGLLASAPHDNPHHTYATTVEQIEEEFFSNPDNDQAYEWSDILCRYGELISFDRDLDRQSSVHLVTAFVVFLLAQRLRERAFLQDPLNVTPMISSHATRALARVALALMRISSTEESLYFARQVRQTADIITRHLGRYPVERANLLVVEASLARAMDRQNLKESLRLLGEADTQLSLVPGWHRVRLRLLLERTKIFRYMYLLEKERDSGSRVTQVLSKTLRLLLDASAYDANLLRRLAENYDSNYWITIAREQERKIQEICAELKYIPNHLQDVWRYSIPFNAPSRLTPGRV